MHGTATKLQNARKISVAGAVKGEVNFDGSGNVTITTTQANIAILEGKLAQDNESDEVDVPYPDGFNKENCVVISKAGVGGTSASGNQFTEGTLYDSRSYMRGGVTLAVTLRNSDIAICAKNINLINDAPPYVGYLQNGSNVNFKYRIVLLKIRE